MLINFLSFNSKTFLLRYEILRSKYLFEFPCIKLERYTHFHNFNLHVLHYNKLTSLICHFYVLSNIVPVVLLVCLNTNTAAMQLNIDTVDLASAKL